ncbi:hypothetical protein V8F20_000623 [Naviculisporaceae sp. PSN 640]
METARQFLLVFFSSMRWIFSSMQGSIWVVRWVMDGITAGRAAGANKQGMMGCYGPNLWRCLLFLSFSHDSRRLSRRILLPGHFVDFFCMEEFGAFLSFFISRWSFPISFSPCSYPITWIFFTDSYTLR